MTPAQRYGLRLAQQQSSPLRRCIVVGVVLVISIIGIVQAFARDPDGRYVGSPYADWFKSQHNSTGQWCCDEADGHYYDGNYTLNPDGSVTIGAGDGARTLPAYMALKGPNPTGRAVWWGFGDVDFCFAPGTLS